MEYLFDKRPDRPGYRLHRLELFNWGTFDSSAGQVYCFEPKGRTSLLVGHNGSGKSTLVDAILTLLVEPRTRNYNVAAGAKKTERTEKSYICGAYARTSDAANSAIIQYLRPKPTSVTALLAVFHDEQLDQSFTLCQVRHLTSDGSPDKLYAMADEARDLKTDLQGLSSSDNVREHLERLGYQTTKKFIQYHGWFTKRTKMRGKATDLFNQTVAVKDIQSLNDFIRRHMLEAHDWRDKVNQLLRHFNDLSIAHQELVRARKSEELLQPVEKRGLKYRQHLAELEQGERKLQAAETFFRAETLRLFQPAIKEYETQLVAIEKRLQRFSKDQKKLAEDIRHLKNEIDRAGGDRLRAIPALLELEGSQLAVKRVAFDRYHTDLKRCHFSETVNKPLIFETMRSQVQQRAKEIAEQLVTTNDHYEDLVATRGELRNLLREEQHELEVLDKRRTNLPARLASLRGRICEDLQLAEDSLPFAAELISVADDQQSWEPSAEMVLRPFALSLLVPEKFYRRVRAYVDQTKLIDAHGNGQRLDYICVGKAAPESGDRTAPHLLIHKLEFRPGHALTPWVRAEVRNRFSYLCCETLDQFHDASRLAMTKNRHVKTTGDRHKKDDRRQTIEPRYFVLGWDNRRKKQRIAESIEQIQRELASLDETIDKRSCELEEFRQIQYAASAILAVVDFDTIDVNPHLAEIAALEKEKRQLENSNQAVKTLKQRLADKEAEAARVQESRDQQTESKALTQQRIFEGRTLVETANKKISAAASDGIYLSHEEVFEAIRESLSQSLSVENLFEIEREWHLKTKQQVDRLRGPVERLGEQLTESMNRYLREFKEEQADLNASVHSLDSFLGLLEQIRIEDLPRHEKKFKDRLNDKVSQEVGLFQNALRREQKQIEKKISQLNAALGQLEYRPGTYMRLDPLLVQDREIDDFRRSLRECLDASFDSSDEANEARYLRIQKLVARLGDSEKSRWRDKVIDVRNWYRFAAHELEKETGTTRSFHEGSTGQSGGEKAKLAFTILVAAIAYQFDIDLEEQSPGRFQFVVVDEMFSKVDDQNAIYALKLFAQFGLQLLIVAPLDAKARVTESFVDQYLQVVKDETTNHSQLYSMTAREYEEAVKQFANNGQTISQRPPNVK